MKRIKSLLQFFFIVCLLLQACKKSGSETPPQPIAFYPFDGSWLKNSISSLLNGQAVDNLSDAPDSFMTDFHCIRINGDGYVKVKDSDLLDFAGNQFTLAVWINPTVAHGTYVINKNDDATSYSPYSLDIHPGVVRAFIRTNTDEQFLIQGKTPIVANAWQHIAATFSGDKLTIYYNGNDEGSVAVDRPLAVNKGDLGIGASIKYYTAAAFKGSIDNVKIYDKALTAAQVKNLYKHYKD